MVNLWVEKSRQIVWGENEARQGKMESNTRWWVTVIMVTASRGVEDGQLLFDSCIPSGHVGWFWKGSTEQNMH